MWLEKDNYLYKKFKFSDISSAGKFIQKITEATDINKYSPRLVNDGQEVEIWLKTNNQDGSFNVGAKDFTKYIDSIHNEFLQNPNLKKIVYKELKLYADGGSRGNPGPSASGFVLLDMDDRLIFKEGVYIGVTTNNQAEYQALKFGLQVSYKIEARIVHVYMDSLLVINQMTGKFKIKNRDLWPINESIKKLIVRFEHVSFQQIPRVLNKLADKVVNDTLDEHEQNQINMTLL